MRVTERQLRRIIREEYGRTPGEIESFLALGIEERKELLK